MMESGATPARAFASPSSRTSIRRSGSRSCAPSPSWPSQARGIDCGWGACGISPAPSASKWRCARADLELANAELLQAKERAERAAQAKSAVPRQHEPRDPHADERRDRHDGAACSTPTWTRMQRDHTETIRDSAAGLLTIINDILDFSKIEAGKLDLERIDMDLRGTVDDVAHLLAIQAHAKGLELITNVDPLLPDRLIGDPGRMRQVLLNLGSNAIKFTRDGEVIDRPAAGSHRCDRHDDPLRSARHRHRNPGRAPRIAVPAVLADRRVDDAALRRHRSRTVDRAPPRRADGRRNRRRKRRASRLVVLVHGAARQFGRRRRRSGASTRKHSRTGAY